MGEVITGNTSRERFVQFWRIVIRKGNAFEAGKEKAFMKPLLPSSMIYTRQRLKVGVGDALQH